MPQSTPIQSRQNRPALGIFLAIFAFICFSMVDTSAKLLVTTGIPVLMVAFARYGINLALVLIWFLPRNGRAALRSRAPKLQILRAIMLLASTLFNFLALKYLPLTTTIPIFFASPLIICLLSVPLLDETVGIRRYIAVIIGFIGVLIIVRPGGISFQPAILISIAATFSVSFYYILTRKLAGRDDTDVSQIYAAGIATIALFPVAITTWQMPETNLQWVAIFGAGLFAAIGHSVITIAYRFQEASKLAPLIYTQIIIVTLISWLVFNQLPDLWTLVGTAVIIASGTYVWLRERQHQKN